MEIISNITQDMVALLRKELDDANIDEVNYKRHIRKYIENKNRVIPPRKYNLYKSEEFQNNSYIDQFSTALSRIEENFKEGQSNRAYHSKNIRKKSVRDLLLNDWGIYHLHLGKTIDKTGFCERTGPVLFLYLTQDTVYFLDLLEHGNGHKHVWVNQKLIKIISNNWPNLIEKYRLKNLDGDLGFSSSERYSLRKAGASTPISIDNKIYVGPGGGQSTDGVSIRFTPKVREVCGRLITWEEWQKESDLMVENRTILLKHYADLGCEKLYLSIVEQNGYLYCCDLKAKCEFSSVDLLCN